MTTPWQARSALRTKSMKSSAIRELLKLANEPGIISFAGGLPAPDMFPVEAFEEATNEVLRRNGAKALQYGATEGYAPLRQFLADKMAAYGIRAKPENILVTSGAQQAIDIIGKILINPGDHVLTERPTYVGALQAWSGYQAQYVTVDVDEHGIQTDQLEAALSNGPKFMYILPNFQNPGGVTLSLARRHELIATAEQYGIPIVEDDPYGELRYEGEHLPPLVVLDNEKLSGGDSADFTIGNVIYLSTFSKTLAPGLRLGWMVAPESVVEQAVIAKQGMDLHTSSFVQMVAYEVVKDGFLTPHVRQIRSVYRERRDVMLAAMAQHFHPQIRWTKPEGGLFLWVTLPPHLNASDLLRSALAQNVAFVPGDAFHPNGGGTNCLRLNFSNATPEKIEAGIVRLGNLLNHALPCRRVFAMGGDR